MSIWTPPGTAETLIGGIAGGMVGVAAGVALGNALAADTGGGLEALGVVLLAAFGGLALGASVGSGIALSVRGHRRALATSLLILPALLAVILVTLRFTSGIDEAVALFVVFASPVVAIWLIRVLVMLPGSDLREE